MENNYDSLAENYVKTHDKPDKKYSMLPTLVSLLELNEKDVVIDVGCGDGFFTIPISEKCEKVIGIDNSIEQIKKANEKNEDIDFRVADMFTFDYPLCDKISCPFVLNYIQNKDGLKTLFGKFYSALNENGKIVGILDMPKELINEAKEWGAIKKIKGDKIEEGVPMDIELYNGEEHLVTLHSFYHEKKVIEDLLTSSGFVDIKWKDAIVSQEGLEKFGKEFWESYKEKIDVVYFVARKLSK